MNLGRCIWSIGNRVSSCTVNNVNSWATSLTREFCSALKVNIPIVHPKLFTLQTTRNVRRGMDYVPNNNKRIKRHGRKKRLSTTSGKIILIRRMMKNVNPRVLTH